MSASTRVAEASIREHSKSFALAARVLPAEERLHAVVLYAWCRRADDAVDLAEPEDRGGALRRLVDELDAVYAGRPLADPILEPFRRTVEARRVPRSYAEDLLRGMAMDVEGRRYGTVDDLLDYCYHVAGCVGLMMSHAMGVADERALVHATHMGMAMQLTNVCRDVEEDWRMGRLYLPDDALARHGAAGLADLLGGDFPDEGREPAARATAEMLDLADRFYASGDAGVPRLSWRCGVAIRTAAGVYSAIGDRVRAAACDPLAGRAYVPLASKLALTAAAVARGAVALGRGEHARRVSIPGRVLRWPDDVMAPWGPT